VKLCPQLQRLQAEHRAFVAQCGRQGSERDAAWTARLLALWDTEIVPHLRVEEEVLLPELSRRIPESDASLVFTLGDHVVLRRLARELRSAWPGEQAALLLEFAARLAEHAAFEERTLFPILQENLGTARLAAFASELAIDQTTRKGAKRRSVK
jgi:iron-sulfur cluster repair protein YtfE (RIC family)